MTDVVATNEIKTFNHIYNVFCIQHVSCDVGWRRDMDTHYCTEHHQYTSEVWYVCQHLQCRSLRTGAHMTTTQLSYKHCFYLHVLDNYWYF